MRVDEVAAVLELEVAALQLRGHVPRLGNRDQRVPSALTSRSSHGNQASAAVQPPLPWIRIALRGAASIITVQRG